MSEILIRSQRKNDIGAPWTIENAVGLDCQRLYGAEREMFQVVDQNRASG